MEKNNSGDLLAQNREALIKCFLHAVEYSAKCPCSGKVLVNLVDIYIQNYEEGQWRLASEKPLVCPYSQWYIVELEKLDGTGRHLASCTYYFDTDRWGYDAVRGDSLKVVRWRYYPLPHGYQEGEDASTVRT